MQTDLAEDGYPIGIRLKTQSINCDKCGSPAELSEKDKYSCNICNQFIEE